MSEPKRYIFRIRECGCVKPEHLEGKYAPSALIIEETEGRCGWLSYEDYDRLKAEVERLKEGNEYLDQMHEKEMARSAFLCEQVERLTKAVMHSPAAQLKLKELEGKTTYEEINPKGGQP